MEKEDAQALFQQNYQKSGVIIKKPVVFEVSENKHGINNVVEDLNINNTGDTVDTIEAVLGNTNTVAFTSVPVSPGPPSITAAVRKQTTNTLTLSEDSSGLKGDVKTQKSLTSDSSGIELVGDAATPGNSKYYGTDSGGTKGFFTVTPAGAALTKTDDTNVTLSLGGSPATALVNATSIAAGWAGTLAISRGGTGASTLLGAGLVAKTATVALTAQTANINATTLTTTGAGLYRVTYYLLDSVADLTAGAVSASFTYTDNGAAQTVTSATVALTILGTFTQGTFMVQLASGNLQYATSHSGIFGTAKYDLFITVERLN